MPFVSAHSEPMPRGFTMDGVPITRNGSREKREKQLLKERLQIKDPHQADIIDNPFKIEPSTDFHLKNSERYITDMAAFDKERRLKERIITQHKIDKKREELLQREENRWRQMDEIKQQEDYKLLRVRELEIKGKKNKTGLPYNPVTLEYNRNKDGLRFQQQDYYRRERFMNRAVRLDKLNNGSHDPITGAPRQNMFENLNSQSRL